MKFYYADGYVLDEESKNELLKSKKIFFCESCNEFHWTHETDAIDVDGKHCCVKHFVRNYAICNSCGMSVSRHSLCQGVCKNCYNKLKKFAVHNYGYQPIQRFYDDNGNYTENPSSDYDGFGIELEVDIDPKLENVGENCFMSQKAQESLNDEVYVKHDGSLMSGFEIITYPHTEKSFYNIPWKESLSTLLKCGYRSHDIKTCGLHMHCSRTNLDDDALTRLVYFYEKFRDDIIKFSRRDGREVNRWAKSYFTSNSEITLEKCKNVVSRYNRCHRHDDRYHCVNLINPNTVEIRIMRGTLNYNTFMATCDFLMTIFKNCRNKFDNLNDLNEWLKGLKPETIEYMKSKQCFGYSTDSTGKECDFNVHNCL